MAPACSSPSADSMVCAKVPAIIVFGDYCGYREQQPDINSFKDKTLNPTVAISMEAGLLAGFPTTRYHKLLPMCF